MFRVKVYRVQGEFLVAICDSDIVGRTFRDKERRLKLEISENFYGKEEVNEEKAKDLLKRATIANISGRKAVNLAIKLGLIDKDKVLVIDGCPHAQMVIL